MYPSTKIGLQAVIALFLSILISNMFHLGKGYWSGMTVVFLFSNTYGETASRAFQRVLSTILGGVLATVVVLNFHLTFYQNFVILLFVIFCMYYAVSISYAVTMFFSTYMVVFMFIALGQWSTTLLFYRITETILGAALVVLVSICFPVKISDKLKPEFLNLTSTIKQLLHLVEKEMKNPNKSKHSIHDATKLITQEINLKKMILASKYENMFKKREFETTNHILNRMQKIIINTESLISAVSSCQHIQSELFHYDEIIRLLINKIEFIEHCFEEKNIHKRLIKDKLRFKNSLFEEEHLNLLASHKQSFDHLVEYTELDYFIHRLYVNSGVVVRLIIKYKTDENAI